MFRKLFLNSKIFFRNINPEKLKEKSAKFFIMF